MIIAQIDLVRRVLPKRCPEMTIKLVKITNLAGNEIVCRISDIKAVKNPKPNEIEERFPLADFFYFYVQGDLMFMNREGTILNRDCLKAIGNSLDIELTRET